LEKKREKERRGEKRKKVSKGREEMREKEREGSERGVENEIGAGEREERGEEAEGKANVLFGLALLLAYPSEEEGGIILVQMISTCLRGKGGVSTL
jgi:hypothetical protein